MKSLLILIFSALACCSFGQLASGTIHYSGRVTHMYDSEGYRIEIPYERQNTNEILGAIYFDSVNLEVDFLATIAYTLNVTLQKEKEWVLYQERWGSEKTAQTVLYDDMQRYTFDSLFFNKDTVRSIAGYPCHLAVYVLAGIPYEVWFSEEITLGGNLLPVPDKILGACLEFTLPLEIADVKYTAHMIDATAPNPTRFEMLLFYTDALEGEPLFPIVEPAPKKTQQHDRTLEIPPPPPPRVEE